MRTPSHFTATQLYKRKREAVPEELRQQPEQALNRTGFQFMPRWRKWLAVVTNRPMANRTDLVTKQP